MRTMFFWKKFPLRSVLTASVLGLGALTASAGTYTNDFNSSGNTPLHEAARQNNLGILKAILQKHPGSA